MFNKSSPITFSRVGISLRVPGSSTTNLSEKRITKFFTYWQKKERICQIILVNMEEYESIEA